jgi:hypothetical protein
MLIFYDAKFPAKAGLGLMMLILGRYEEVMESVRGLQTL